MAATDASSTRSGTGSGKIQSREDRGRLAGGGRHQAEVAWATPQSRSPSAERRPQDGDQLPRLGAKVKLKDLAVLSRQFATMINSGLSLLRALAILEEQTQNKDARPGARRGPDRTSRPACPCPARWAKHPDDLPAADDQHGEGRRGRRLPRRGHCCRSRPTTRPRSSCAEGQVGHDLPGRRSSSSPSSPSSACCCSSCPTFVDMFTPARRRAAAAHAGSWSPCPAWCKTWLPGPDRAGLIVGVFVWTQHQDPRPGSASRRPDEAARCPVFGTLFRKIALSAVHPQPRHDDPLRRPDPAGARHRRGHLGQRRRGPRGARRQGQRQRPASRSPGRCRSTPSSRRWSCR